MVFEQIYDLKWLSRKPQFAFLLGVFYAILGIFGAIILFPTDPALVAVGFTSLLLLPSLYLFFGIEERTEEKESTFKFTRLFIDNKALIKIFLFAFFGVLIVFAFFSIRLETLATNHIFKNQAAVINFCSRDSVGGAVYHQSFFMEILVNNFKVLIFSFLLSFLAGNGAIFLITWNASVWGTVFGIIAKTVATNIAVNPFIKFLEIMIYVFPHTTLEALAYILAAISGSVISRDILKEQFNSPRFYNILFYNIVLLFVAIGVLVIGAIVESIVIGLPAYIKIRGIAMC